MKEKGYTLAEVLIALGIVGVLAAVMLPMVNKYKPDTTKVLYLNTYDALAETISAAANNGGYYVRDNGTFSFEKHPFANLDDYTDNTNNSHRIAGGQNKLCRVMAENFNIIDELSTISSGNTVCRNNAVYNPDNFSADFTNKNGVAFMITTSTNAPQKNNNNYQTDIVIDINGINKGDNCIYNANSCKKPDRFTFRVSADAELQPTDEMGIRYLETRTNLKYKKVEDYSNNSQLARDIEEALQKSRIPFERFDLPDSATLGNQGNNEGNDGDDGLKVLPYEPKYPIKPMLEEPTYPEENCTNPNFGKSAGYDSKGNELHYSCN